MLEPGEVIPPISSGINSQKHVVYEVKEAKFNDFQTSSKPIVQVTKASVTMGTTASRVTTYTAESSDINSQNHNVYRRVGNLEELSLINEKVPYIR